MLGKFLSKVSGLNPEGISIGHDALYYLEPIIEEVYNKGINIETSARWQGVFQGFIAYYCVIRAKTEPGIERAALGEVYRKAFPGSWRNIANNIKVSVSTQSYAEGIEEGMEFAKSIFGEPLSF